MSLWHRWIGPDGSRALHYDFPLLSGGVMGCATRTLRLRYNGVITDRLSAIFGMSCGLDDGVLSLATRDHHLCHPFPALLRLGDV